MQRTARRGMMRTGTSGAILRPRPDSAAAKGASHRMKQIAIIDDDVYIGDMLEEVLRLEGYDVLRAYSGTEAVLLVQAQRPDLVLLDLMMPGLSGQEVLPKLSGIPVIVLSARCDIQDKVQLLLEGAADYLTKPFDTRELLARVSVQLRRGEIGPTTLLRRGALAMDQATRSVSVAGEPVHLTRTEYAILKLLLENPGQVVTKSRLLDDVSQDTPDCVEGSLKVHISNLRKKLRQAGAGDCIEAVWGIGFRLV